MTPEQAIKRVRFHMRWISGSKELTEALTIVTDLAEQQQQAFGLSKEAAAAGVIRDGHETASSRQEES